MRHLVICNTPGHVHTYRNAVTRLTDQGHDVLVLVRDYTCTVPLCEYYDLPHAVYGSHGTERYSVGGFARELPAQLYTVLREARRFDPDVTMGRGPYAGLAAKATGSEAVLLLDSEPSDFLHNVSSTLADLVMTPASFRGRLGDDHYTFDGLKECAYLHPETFEADPSVREELGVGPDEDYVILRFNAFDALHDVDEHGLTREEERGLVHRLSDHATVFVSHEGDGLDLDDTDARDYDLHPARMHDALAEASLLVAETGTMVTEAALLGTPAIGCGAFADWDFGEFEALEAADLITVTGTFDATVEAATEYLADPDTEVRWERRRDTFMDERVDLTSLIVDVATDPWHARQVAELERRREERARKSVAAGE